MVAFIRRGTVLGSVVLMLLFVSAGSASLTRSAGVVPLFTDSGQSLGNVLSSAVALGDVDGDGDLDAVVAQFELESQIYVNTGGVQGGTPGVFAAGAVLDLGFAVDVALGDLDGDGDLDIFVVRDAFSTSNRVYINQGGVQGGTTGAFLTSGQSFGNDLTSAVALADLDGDNDLDAWIARTAGRADLVWLNDGSGQFTDSGQSLGGDSSTEVALGDVDGDGDADAAVTTGAANKIWINQGGAQAGAAGTFLDSGQSLGDTLSNGVALADLDGDGDRDLYVANVNVGDRVYMNQGGAQAGAAGTFLDSGQSLGANGGRDVALADLDGDGDRDAFVARSAPNAVWVNNGGTFTSSGQSLGTSLSEGVALGDVDGDGDLDAFVANWPDPDRVYVNGTINTPPPLNPEGWQIQIPAAAGRTGLGLSMALDSLGRPHLSYIRRSPSPDGTDYYIHYNRWDGVRWIQDVVTRLKDAPFDARTSLALDAQDRPHIAYPGTAESNNPALHYATWSLNEGWLLQVVELSEEPNEGINAELALALDGQGRPHISYSRKLKEELRHAAHDGSGWTLETVTGALGADQIALAVAADGTPHIFFHGPGLSDVTYAWKSGAGWQMEPVGDDDADGGVSIVLDGSGRPHVSYIYGFGRFVRHAVRDGGGWQIENAESVGGAFVLPHSALALDGAGEPSIAYILESAGTAWLMLARRSGGTWSNEVVDGTSIPERYLALSIGPDGRPQVAYYDAPYSDLRYAAHTTRWQVAPLGSAGPARGVSIALDDSRPAIGYYAPLPGLALGARWGDGNWFFDPAGFSSAPITDTSIAYAGGNPHLSYYDADNQRLMLSGWTGGAYQSQIVDESADVGRQSELYFAGNSPLQARIAYWDATQRRVKLAMVAIGGTAPALTTNFAGPALNSASGYPQVHPLPDSRVGVTYYHAAARQLRYATYDIPGGGWTDEAIGPGSRHHDLAVDGGTGFPVVAFYDPAASAIRFGVREGPGWQFQTVVTGLSGVDGLTLALGLESKERARIGYVDRSDGVLRFARLEEGTWTLESIVQTGGAPSGLGLAVGSRPHMAYGLETGGPGHLFRSGTLDVPLTPFTPPAPPTGYNPMDACLYLLDVYTGGDPDPLAVMQPLSPPGTLSDASIFAGMTRLFDGSAAGRGWIDGYAQHGREMGRIGIQDPLLLWDAYGTLQNFMPGLEALVTGRGDEVLVTQEMVDDALDVWQRIAAAASPDLALAINSELLRFNNLQEFVGMSFADWAEEIGVHTERRYFPLFVGTD